MFSLNLDMDVFLRGLQKCIETRFQLQIGYQHVKAHSGEPGNELVDTLAYQAAMGEPLHTLSDWLRSVTTAHFVSMSEWFWYLFRSDLVWNGSALCLPAAPATVPPYEIVNVSGEIETASSPLSPVIGELSLRLATCNVLTLSSGQGKQPNVHGPSRQDSLLRQLEEAQIHIFAMQETRLKRLTNAHDSRYWLYKAAATAHGHYGIIIGLMRSRPIGKVRSGETEKEIFISQEDASVIATDPRFLILRLKTTLFRAIVVAGHAPHSGATEAEISAWWKKLASAIPAKYDMWPRLLLVDANARVGSEPCQHIGPHQAEKGSGKEEGFTQFVRSQGLFLPATFAGCHSGEGGTWLHNNGSWCRNDFIGLPSEWHYDSCHSWVSTSIDVGLVKEDHRVPIVHLVRSVSCLPHSVPKKPFKLNLQGLAEMPIVPLPPYTWALDVHSHAHQLQNDLVDQLWSSQTKKVRQPLKATMSLDTWDLVTQKREARNELGEHGRVHRRTLLAAWFVRWRHAAVELESCELLATYDALLRQQDHLIAVAYHRFRCLGRQVVKALRRDDVAFYDNLLQEGAAFLGPHAVKSLWKVVRRSLPKFQQRRMTTPPFQLEGLEDQWLPHFGQLEAGTLTTMPDLLQGCVHRQTCSLFDAPRTIRLGDLPSVFALEDAFRRTASDKATGDDPIPSGLFHYGAHILAGAYHDLLIKEFLWQSEPLQYKGGPVAIIPKCLAPTTAKQFRGILLLGNMAKRTHSVLRQQVLSCLTPQRAPGQLGGFPGQQVMFGSQALRLFGVLADRKGVSSAVLFLDLSNAFHHLVRELVTGLSTSSNLDEVLAVLQKSGHPAEKIQAACQLPGLLEELGASPTLTRLMCDIHAETWCSLPNRQCLHTHRGTRPGSPLADIVFHVLMAAIAKDVDAWIAEHKVHLPVLADNGEVFPSILWADDVAVPLATYQAGDLVPLLLDLLRAIRESLHGRGFLLNFALGKTNAVVSFRGSGASVNRQRYQLIPTPGVLCTFADKSEAWLHFVPVYKHLGTIYASDHGLDVELSARIGLAASAFTHLSRPLLTNRHLPKEVRLRFFQALIASKLFFGLGAWHTPTPKQLQRLSGFYANSLKKVMRYPKDKWMQTHAQVYADAHVLDVRVRLAVDRLLYAQRVYAVGPAFLQNIIHYEADSTHDSWLAGLRADLAWVQEINSTVLPCGWETDLTPLIDSWQEQGSRWKSTIKAVAKKHQCQEKMMAEVVTLHKAAFEVLRQSGASFLHDPFSAAVAEGVQRCFCGEGFASHRGLLAHQRRKHKLFSPEHPFLQEAICLHCGKFCWTTQRLQQHLAYIPKKLGYNPCYQALSTQGRHVEYAAVKMPKAVVGLARRESLPTCGPWQEPITLVEKQRQAWATELADCQQRLVVTDQPDDALGRGEQIGDALTDFTQQWFQMHYPVGPSEAQKSELIDGWIQILCIDYGEGNIAWDNWLAMVFLAWGNHWLPDVIAEFLDGEAEYVVDDLFAQFAAELPRYQTLARISFLETSLRHCEEEAPKPHRTVKTVQCEGRNPKCTSKVSHLVKRAYGEQESWLNRLRQCKFDVIPEEAQCPRYRELEGPPLFIVVHLFSGRRRDGDFHCELRKMAEGCAWQVLVLSLDTAVSMEYGNLMKGTTSWDMLSTLYLDGRVAATLCGPPCETFSEARFTEPPDPSFSWPRPLRSSARLFGLEGLSLKELRQCAVGSSFFLQCIWVLCIHIVKGGFFVAEHPALPFDPSRPSIWSSPIVQLLLQLPDLRLHHVAQYRWGADVVKPTGLLTWALPFFPGDLYERALSGVVKPTSAAIGIDEQGRFRTARHKEYPGPFCQAIANAFAKQFCRIVQRRMYRTPDAAHPAQDEWISSAAQASECIRASMHWLPDFQDL